MSSANSIKVSVSDIRYAGGWSTSSIVLEATHIDFSMPNSKAAYVFFGRLKSYTPVERLKGALVTTTVKIASASETVKIHSHNGTCTWSTVGNSEDNHYHDVKTNSSLIAVTSNQKQRSSVMIFPTGIDGKIVGVPHERQIPSRTGTLCFGKSIIMMLV
jgi:hypothetical protein